MTSRWPSKPLLSKKSAPKFIASAVREAGRGRVSDSVSAKALALAASCTSVQPPITLR